MAGSRREGRILAAQFLYQREVGVSGVALEEALKEFWELSEAEAKAKEFAEGRIRAVLEKQREVDTELQKLVTNWEPGRLAPVDRAILRLALWEMKWAEDVPPIAALNEAIEVAKALSTEES
ncbi:MAG: transcription antitermination factor NusB, partial [Verrucomicrobia bacterium]|nr:transcription antitermination factor NusB [Verrucomicrobiota bacterium]